MLRHLLLLALCVFPAIAIECDKCTGKECFAACFFRQKGRTAEAQAKCGDGGLQAKYDALKVEHDALKAEDWKTKYDELKVEHDALKADCTTTTRTTTTTTTGDGVDTPVDPCFTNGDGCDGSAAGVDQCFLTGGNCDSCCGACAPTFDLDNRDKNEPCVCYESYIWFFSHKFKGTDANDCVFIEAENVDGVNVRNQCLEGAEEGFALPRRGS